MTRKNKSSRTLPPAVGRLPLRVGSNCTNAARRKSESRKNDSGLGLVFAFFVFVADFAVFVRLKEKYLAEAFVGVDFCGERRGVADFERDEAFPFGLERRDVDDDAAARVSGFAEADRQHIAWDAEIFDGTGEGE